VRDKERYRLWCAQELDIPVFAQDWWLDAVCAEANWDVILIDDGGEIVAAMPYCLKRRGLFSIVSMPPFTQTLGPYIKYPERLNHAQRLSWDKKVLNRIIDELPKCDHILIKCHHRIVNWLPFYWRGFGQITSYTYIIPNISEPDRVLAGFDEAKRSDVKRAAKRVTVQLDMSPDAFYSHHANSLRKQGQQILYSYDAFRRIHDAARFRNAGRIFYAIDEVGNVHSALFVVWGRESAYHLVTTLDPEFRSSGSMSLLVFEGIREVSRYTKRYDFEGSMIEGVEASYRRFGAVQTPYFRITKTPSRILRLRKAAIDVLRNDKTLANATFFFDKKLTPRIRNRSSGRG